jgi:hypothetical protein
MSKKTIGFILITLGVILAVISLGADIIGNAPAYFGLKQWLGVSIGLIAAFAGVWLNLSDLYQKK